MAVANAGGVDGRFRCSAGSIGWVAVAVADAGGVDGWFCCRAGSFWRWQWLWPMLGEWKWTAGFAAALVALVAAFEVVAMVVFPLFGG